MKQNNIPQDILDDLDAEHSPEYIEAMKIIQKLKKMVLSW